MPGVSLGFDLDGGRKQNSPPESGVEKKKGKKKKGKGCLAICDNGRFREQIKSVRLVSRRGEDLSVGGGGQSQTWFHLVLLQRKQSRESAPAASVANRL